MNPGLRVFATEVVLIAGTWTLLFQFNSWLFTHYASSPFVNWVFLPAALRLVAVLLLGWRGALGLFLGGLFTGYLIQTPWPTALVLAALSALAPVVAVRIASDWLKLRSDLAGLRFSDLLVLAALGAVCSGLMHQLYLGWTNPHPDWLRHVLAMVCGDLLGTLIVMALAVVVLRRVQSQP